MDASIARKILRDSLRTDRIAYPPVRVLTTAHDNDRSLLLDGKWYSPLVDTIEDDLKTRSVSCASIARIISRIKGERAYGHVLSPEGAFARALVMKRLAGFFVRGRYCYSHSEEEIWAKILRQTGAKFALGIQPSREMCAACHKLGVWVADVQHGVIGDSHPWYGHVFRSPDPVEWLPDAFLCWDHGSAEVLQRWTAPKGIDTVVTGNRWLRRFLYPQTGDRLVNGLRADFEASGTKNDGRPTVLVALSWGDTNIPNGFMVDELLHVIQTTADRYRWWVRLHPNQLNGFATHEGRAFKKQFARKLDGYVEWERVTKAALPLLLSQVNLHISWNSSVAIEASQAGVPSALLDPRLRGDGERSDYYSYYKQQGMIELLEVKESTILNWLHRNSRRDLQPEDFGSYDAAYEKIVATIAA